ncbi:MAG: ATP-binding protein, partial [Bacteroidota bacterium]
IEEALNKYYFEPGQREALQLDLDQDFEVNISKEYFRHVLFNLLKNSYRHAGTQHIAIRLEGRKVYVRDEGKGIAPADLARIFDLFYTQSGQGTGIGLALCRYIMEAFGGTITCRSEQGNDSFTEFVLEFPEKL